MAYQHVKLERAGSEPVVGVEEEDVRCPCSPPAVVARRGDALVLLPHELDVVREARKRLRRTVVDDDDPRAFAERALHGFAEVCAVVVVGDHDRDVAHSRSRPERAAGLRRETV